MNDFKIFPLYFPQLYSIPENDLWWGDGFTDWDLVRKSTPSFSGHYQPRVPTLGYLDQSLPSTIETQCNLAKSYGVTGFNFYHYWFDGKVLLDAPVNNLLNNSNIDFEFFFTWANENWTRQWVGKPNDILIKNTYTPSKEMWGEHFDYLLNFFKDPRYTKIKNKPVFCIYRPEIIISLNEMLVFFNQKALEAGFDGIHFIAMRAYSLSGAEQVYSMFEAIINFQPRFAVNKYLSSRSSFTKRLESVARKLPESIQSKLSYFTNNYSVKSYSYTDYVSKLDSSQDLTIAGKVCYQVVFPDWDNTPRYNDRATLFSDISLEQFETALRIVKNNLRNVEDKLVIINAWNEWSEGAYLEPDELYGLKKLDIIKQVFHDDI
ncbi:glycoside hydrolase family 99-like domain-containing protein [Shewanella inventionis]|uniref:glycosyltransferase WbsX family protein n=1 Tax=Shewanella inventionis TaxID=1738770 RepID=UPI001CBDA1F5|nr:glycoside hydrolase family 99-like domain-containing protein [Shewanella inventionis]UAL42638.1 glycoside hydrolase family 99-like domain-containing protein [Shewanella inventionis]